ncbi:MAG: sigma-54-dependent Fis family transcriptional regulator [Alphaproteobacteria bacterium]|nr:sigma-54-dependent Fis family transcriptional regulator [Alphaproteobacteria bacterium]
MRLLIVGTLGGQFGAATKIAVARGADVRQVDGAEAALEALRGGDGADLVMIDVHLAIKEFIDRLRSERITVPVVACGTGTDAGAAVRAIKAGAQEYVPLPPEPELIAAVLEAASDEGKSLLFRDPAMSEVVRLADQVAPSDASVLLTGESGTGKEVLARYIHSKSRRAGKRFVSVNCAAIPETLLESELFGYEKGAFTGAVARRLGKFEEANGGTLLLDEISEMDVRLQAKLLRVLQEREVDRLGGTKPVKVDIRLLATSNRDLAAEVQKGAFREDLLYRLNVMHIKIPPLRSRPLDISILADHFVAKYAEQNGVGGRTLAKEAREALLRHRWRGNVRELENTLHRAVLLAAGTEISANAIVFTDGGPAPAPALAAAPQPASVVPATPASAAAGGANLVGRTVAEVEQQLILDTLQHCFGNRTHAATILGISIRTLRNKLKQYSDMGLPVPAPGEAGRVGA